MYTCTNCTNNNKPTETIISHHNPSQPIATHHKPSQPNWNHHKPAQAVTTHHNPSLTVTNHHKASQPITNHHKAWQPITNRHRPPIESWPKFVTRTNEGVHEWNQVNPHIRTIHPLTLVVCETWYSCNTGLRWPSRLRATFVAETWAKLIDMSDMFDISQCFQCLPLCLPLCLFVSCMSSTCLPMLVGKLLPWQAEELELARQEALRAGLPAWAPGLGWRCLWLEETNMFETRAILGWRWRPKKSTTHGLRIQFEITVNFFNIFGPVSWKHHSLAQKRSHSTSGGVSAPNVAFHFVPGP